MGTIPRENLSKKKIILFFKTHDIHKWIIGRETGAGGYNHYQIRFQGSDEIFDEFKNWFKKGHIEKANENWSWNYESKEGNYLTSEDDDLILRQRFGRLNPEQQLISELAKATGTRDIIVWHTEEGCKGKSFWSSAMWERRLSHNILPSNTAKGLIQDVASEVIENGKRPIIIIDIPRTWKWTEELYFAIEKIKDGLIKDTRYHSRTINLGKVAIVVMCNSYPKVGKLSADRWVIYSDEHP